MDISDVKDQLTWACDVLIPADSDLGMPSAIEVDVPETLLSRVLRVRPDMAEPIILALSRLPPHRPAFALQALIDLGEADFGLVSRYIAGAYFLDKGVREKIGYPGQEALPLDPDYDEIVAVAEKVQARGQIFRVA